MISLLRDVTYPHPSLCVGLQEAVYDNLSSPPRAEGCVEDPRDVPGLHHLALPVLPGVDGEEHVDLVPSVGREVQRPVDGVEEVVGGVDTTQLLETEIDELVLVSWRISVGEDDKGTGPW